MTNPEEMGLGEVPQENPAPPQGGNKGPDYWESLASLLSRTQSDENETPRQVLNVTLEGDNVVITFMGGMREPTDLAYFEYSLDDIADRHSSKNVIVDLHAFEELIWGVIQKLLLLDQRLRTERRKLVIRDPSPLFVRTIEMMKWNIRFTIEEPAQVQAGIATPERT